MKIPKDINYLKGDEIYLVLSCNITKIKFSKLHLK